MAQKSDVVKKKMAGRLGVWLSFFFMFKEISQSGSNLPHIIFEDDVDLQLNFLQTLDRKMKQVNNDWDILLCGHCCLVETIIPKEGSWFTVGDFAALHCFIVRNASVAQRIADEIDFTEFAVAVDFLLSNLAKDGFFKIYGMIHQMATQRRDMFESNIPLSGNLKPVDINETFLLRKMEKKALNNQKKL